MSRLVYLGKGLELAPSTLRRLIGQVDPACYDERLGPDRFTLREVVAHMADLEPVITGRMEAALANPGSGIESWDEDKAAIDKNYASWDVASSLDLYAQVRLKTFTLFESLTTEQTRLSVVHPYLGEMSIFDLAVFALGHDAYHFNQISEYFPR